MSERPEQSVYRILRALGGPEPSSGVRVGLLSYTETIAYDAILALLTEESRALRAEVARLTQERNDAVAANILNRTALSALLNQAEATSARLREALRGYRFTHARCVGPSSNGNDFRCRACRAADAALASSPGEGKEPQERRDTVGPVAVSPEATARLGTDAGRTSLPAPGASSPGEGAK